MLYNFMTCKGREDYADYLKKELPQAGVFYDGVGNATQNFLNMLSSVGDEPSVFMEDDILLCSRFTERIEVQISRRPMDIINFFSRRIDDMRIGPRYIGGAAFSSNCCVYYPRGMAAAVVKYYDVWPRREKELNGHGFDYLVADFLKENKRNYWNVVPSLVQHRVGPSAIDKKRPKNRVSATFKR